MEKGEIIKRARETATNTLKYREFSKNEKYSHSEEINRAKLFCLLDINLVCMIHTDARVACPWFGILELHNKHRVVDSVGMLRKKNHQSHKTFLK